VLFDRRLRHGFLEALDIGRDVQRLDIGQLADMVTVAPAEKQFRRPVIRHARILVADGGGENFRNRRAAALPASATMPGTRRPDRVATTLPFMPACQFPECAVLTP
jgi:predicted glycosyltransferase